MFTLGFLSSLGSAYFRYKDLSAGEEEEKKLKAEEEMKEIENKV